MTDLSEEELNNEPEDMLEDPDFMKKLLEAKKSNATNFESYWEKDENNIETWTNVSLFIHSTRIQLYFNNISCFRMN
jgi:hypothetical protein